MRKSGFSPTYETQNRRFLCDLCGKHMSAAASTENRRASPPFSGKLIALRMAVHPLIIRSMPESIDINTLRGALAPYGAEIVCAYLFGSQARGEAGAESDVDVAVLYREEPEVSLSGLGLELAAAIEKASGRRTDVVVLNRAPPDLVHRVLRDGVLLLESDSEARIRFETRSRAEYLDLLPYLREYRRAAGSRHDRP
jgi:uncharacterized protein